jgi:FkbM family methyltransferase
LIIPSAIRVEFPLGDNLKGETVQFRQAIKGVIRNTFRKAGFSIMKYPSSPYRTMPIFDLSVCYLMGVKGKALQFVQIGANDGVFGDPLRRYITRFPWRGILVEPQPAVFDKLRSNYQGEKDRLAFENIAISNHTGQITMYGPSGKEADTGGFETTVVSVDAAVAGKQLKKRKGQLKAFTVPCLTLNELLEKYELTSWDILQIDVEGHEFKILSTLDLSRFSPLLIQFECGHLSPADLDGIVRYLAKADYRIMYGGIQSDSLAFHKNFPLDLIAG